MSSSEDHKKEEDLNINDSEIIYTSSSNESSNNEENPIELSISYYENQQHPNRHRNSSFVSISKKSIESIRKCINGEFNNEQLDEQNQKDQQNQQDINNYSIHQIYGDLNSDEINLQRTATRKTILSEIEQNIIDETNDLSTTDTYTTDDVKDDDDEKKIKRPIESEDPAIEDQILPIKQHGEEFNKIDPELITWNGTKDPEDPRNWNITTKIILLGFVSLYALVAPLSSSILSPAMNEISHDFNITNPIIQAMVVSIQILAWAFGPLIIAPLSEYDIFGRKIILDLSCWMSFFFNLGCAFSKNTYQMMIFRFIGGLFGCVPMNVCAGVISDLFDSQSRNAALAGYSLVPLLGPVISPLVAGFIVDNMNWRWCFYVLCMFNGFVAVIATIFFKETYSPTLLRRKCLKLKKITGNENLHTIYDITNGGETKWGRLWLCMSRPVTLLFTHPMIIGLGSFMAFTYGFMYLMIITFPMIFEKQYGYSKSITGLMYLPMGCGFIFGVLFWTFMVGKVYKNLTKKNHGISKPEFRLPCLIACSIFIPTGLIWFGWSAQYELHWIMPGIGSAIFAFGLVCVFQTIQNYLIDMNVRFAASSVAAAALFRSLFGFTFPLFAKKMYVALNYGWGNTMMGFIGILLGVPFPIFCYLYGEKIRNSYNKKFEIKQQKRDQKNLQRLKRQNGEKECKESMESMVQGGLEKKKLHTLFQFFK
ncbi:hypothetical protein KGF54_002836 [Candida jiufengensis]|uniref:uncharacterized protein n=1 Tax=Candida jiufengensis TaxID=497108 RepID=UPI002225B227|nr:uncharacterized protein KGF54_002836 [Candida jiufengensis]KAI5953464.1 hypothetical protein KGF54_002836 [Candida jiufengensis]